MASDCEDAAFREWLADEELIDGIPIVAAEDHDTTFRPTKWTGAK
jgi:hypothetical protein